MKAATISGMSNKNKRYLVPEIHVRRHKKRLNLANDLIDTILICLNAHLQGVSDLRLDDTAKSIVHEIYHYKDQNTL